MSDFKRVLVTSALPYANGPLHIGHMAGVYVPSDIYTRYLRLKGVDVLSVCGSDEHGVPITLKARSEGVTPQEVVDRYHEINKRAFEEFGIAFDIYARTSSPVHHETASAFFRKLYDAGEFVEKSSMQLYDEEAECFLADRYITGTCPHCGYDKAYGDQCESCGTSLSPTELKNPRSTISGAKPVTRETLHWFLPLDRYEGWLREWILEEHKEWKSNVYGQCKSWIDQGLQPRAVSRDLDWGVPVPVEGADGKVLYVWFDAPIGYISATRELTPDWEKYWKDKDTRLVHFIGKDNIVFHCIIFPAMLRAEGSFILPDNVPANEFLNLEGDKISTSRNWAVWLHEYLEDFPGKQDVLRYMLCAGMPEAKDNDFTWKEFQARNNNELVAVLGNFVNRALVLTSKYYQGAVPSPGELNDYDREALAEIARSHAATGAALENFRFREALKEAMGLARTGNKYLADTEPWKLIKSDEERVRTIMYVSLQITAALSVLLEPFLPNTMKVLRQWLGSDSFRWDDLSAGGGTTADVPRLIEPGSLVASDGLLFEKIEDDIIEKQIERLMERKESNMEAEAGAEAKPEPAKDNIGYDTFMASDLRVATVLEAERVPKTDRLLKLTVDTGIDTRTIVAGMAEHYKPEDVVGMQVCIVANLEPRKIRGIESRGMVLMAEDSSGKLTLVSPIAATGNGSIIK